MTSPNDLHLRLLPERRAGVMPYRMGRHVEQDPRSRQYNAARFLDPRRAVVSVEHQRISPIFDQGNLGSCTGMAMAGWLGCAPHCGDPIMFRENEAVWLYNGGTWFDPFEGHHPPTDTGSSNNAVCKNARHLGMILSWSWTFNIADDLAAIQLSPLLFGSSWLEEMFYPDRDGVVRARGEEVGGHAYLARGYDAERRRFLCDNSWGVQWGLSGSFWLPLSEWEILRGREADVVIPRV
jgi:hypothetical protein